MTGGGNVPVAPSAETRVLAHSIREVYLALTREGFTKDEAMELVGRMLAAAGEQGQS